MKKKTKRVAGELPWEICDLGDAQFWEGTFALGLAVLLIVVMLPFVIPMALVKNLVEKLTDDFQ